MLHFRSLFTSLLAWTALSQFTLSAAVPIPDNDPFYQPPSGFASSPPGTVFKSRTVNSGMLFVTATQILYRTTDANGAAAATVATILKGLSSSSSKLVVYNDYEDAANNTCSPSYLFNSGNPSTAFGPTFGDEVKNGLSYGYTMVIADYEGFKSAFSVGRRAGYAVLDALRATKNYGPAGISANAIMGGFGYSGGAIATGWAAALHPVYAPELPIKGWAFGGTPANVTSTLLAVDGTLFAGFGAGGIAGQIQEFPEAQQRFNQVATQAGKDAIAKVLSQCAVDDLFGFAYKSILTTQYQSLGPALLADPVVASVLAKGNLGIAAAETPSAPVYMYHGKADEVIPYQSAYDTAQRWCQRGAQISFLTDTGGAGHAGVLFSYSAGAQSWLNDRMSGKAATSGCSFTTSNKGGISLKRDGTYEDILKRFGPRDSNLVARMTEQWERGETMGGLFSDLH